jgi:ribosomal protein L29
MKREARQFREKTTEELRDDLTREREHLFKGLKLPLAGGQKVNAHETRQCRRRIALLETLLREREFGLRGQSFGGMDGRHPRADLAGGKA